MIDLAQRLAGLSPVKRRLLEERLRRDPTIAEPIAVVGMALRFPGADTLEAYWRLIHDGIDATSEIPPSRWDMDALYDPSGEQTGKMSVRWAGLVEGIDRFDPQFFGISPREAARMDPQQRLLLEVAWEALENACLPADQLAGSATGVFVGIGGTDYSKLPAQFDDYLHHIDAHVGTGNALSIAANRLSYVFDLRGPSLAVDTACSSSTMGIHLAIQSLRNRECETALAGGVNAILTPETTIAFSKARMLSPDGRCRPFDAGANGYVRGEGCGLLVLKRLTDATSDGNPILAVIRASATNQDGRTSGITAPNGLAQQATIREALKQAGLKHQQITYVEAHGTGTPLGDPIEVEALGQVFPRGAEREVPCYVTSVKANVGHMETVSGVAGIIKVVLMMQHRFIPGQLHFQQLNPRISLEGTRLIVPSQPVPWPADGPMLAGVSSFGFGGANTHIILESAQVSRPREESRDRCVHVLPLSAKNEEALRDVAARLASHIEAAHTTDESLADIAFSAAAGRSHLPVRAAIVTDQRDEALVQLRALSEGPTKQSSVHGPRRSSGAPRVAFLFTGQGAQYPQMGRELYETHPVFRKRLECCQEILQDVLDVPLLSLLFPGLDAADHDGNVSSDERIHETCYTQPALFALEYALAELWRSWGIEPHVVLGHSVGEYTAACVAGIIELEDGLRLIARRGRLMHNLPRTGAMAVVFADPEVVERAIAGDGRVEVAAYNGPQNTVISGEATAVHDFIEQFSREGIGAKTLQVSHAFHSPQMEPILDEFEAFAESFEFRSPRIPLIANLTGEAIEQWGPHHLREHIRESVRFAASMKSLVPYELDAVLEVGPTPSLLGMGRRCLPDMSVRWLPSLRPGQAAWKVLLGSLAELYTLGAAIDWKQFDRPWQRHWVALPTYPFQRERFWLEAGDASRRDLSAAPQQQTPTGDGSLLGRRIPSPLPSQLYQSHLAARHPEYLADHQVQQSIVFPATGYLEIGLAAAAELHDHRAVRLRNVVVHQAMFLSEEQHRVVHTNVSPPATGLSTWEVYSNSGGESEDWTLHASGQIELPGDEVAEADRTIDVEAITARLPLRHTRAEFYEQLMADRQLEYGPAFQVLTDVCRNERESLAEFQLHADVVDALDRHQLHPAVGDGLFQTAAGLVPLEEDGSYSPFTYMPTGVREVRVCAPLTQRMFSYGIRTSTEDQPSPEAVEGDLALVDADGRLLVEMRGVTLRRVGSGSRATEEDRAAWLHDVRWETSNEGHLTPASSHAQAWMIFACEQTWPHRFAEQLRAMGHRVVLVRSGTTFRCPSDSAFDFEIDPLSADDYVQLFEAVWGSSDGRERDRWKLLHCWSLSLSDQATTQADFQEIRRLGCGSLLQLVRAAATQRDTHLQLSVITRGAQAVCGNDTSIAPSQAPVWGLGRVAAIEHPELNMCLVDLDPQPPENEIDACCRDLLSPEDDQWAYRDARRWVPRLRAIDAREDLGATAPAIQSALPDHGPYQLRLKAAGSFDSLAYEPSPRDVVEPGQVEVRVAAAGLNFSDVLKAMGLYPGIHDAVVPLGIECAGEVTAVGAGVRHFQVGDRVMGIAPYSFASHARTADYCLVICPDNFSARDAVTIPITFLTAYHALVRLADLQSGERVLIHAGAGGVGLAAIQIAQHIGATIFATAGSDVKRDYLRALGVEDVFNSRTLDFADEIRGITDGAGVDVVLNSLPGEAIPTSLSLLRAYGRFLEIGKTDIYQNRMLGLEPFQDNLSYFAIDLDRMLRQRPAQIRRLFAEVMSYFEEGVYQPLPATEFDATETIDAFRYMAKRQNIGKVVVCLDANPARDEAPLSGAPAGTCLITGGLGALGLRVAEWISQGGPAGSHWTHIALLSRRPPQRDALTMIETLRRNGCQVCVLSGDVADRESLAEALDQIPSSFPPLRGVFHAAGALSDGMLFEMDLDQLEVPLRAKVDGTWNLHRLTAKAPLERFVLFSSIACLLGSPGQGNYAAANAFLDSFAAWRRRQGLPATSINWGPWAEVGMAARDETGTQLAARGLRMLPPDACLQVLDQVLQQQRTRAAVLDVDWSVVRRNYAGHAPSLLNELGTDVDHGPDGSTIIDQAFLSRIQEADRAGRLRLLQDYFADELARIMGLERERLDDSQPLNELGLDSLLAMELKNNLERRLDFSLPIAAFMDAPSIASLAANAVSAVGRDASQADPPDESTGTGAPFIVLQPHGTRRPLVCLHPLGGDIGCYRGLAEHMGDMQPLIALRGRGSDGQSEADRSLAAMIDSYAEAILLHHPHGPYHLAGWSAGGIFAYALARELHSRGAEVRQLLLFDTPLPSIYDHVELNDHARFLADFVEFANMFLGSAMRLDYAQLRDLDEDAAFAVAMREAETKNVVAGFGAENDIRRLVEVGRTHARFIKAYTLEPIDVPIHLILPREKGKLESASGQQLPDDLGWGPVLGDRLQILDNPGDHFTMMLGENAAHLAEQVRHLLSTADADAAGSATDHESR